MLIWIGNLPEEIPYYLKRTRGGWGWYAALAVLFHFPIPFLLLLFRRVKSNPVVLRNIAIMLVLVIAFDVMWWIAPVDVACQRAEVLPAHGCGGLGWRSAAFGRLCFSVN